jgi:DNA-3-methyladenine glycosylase II
VSRASFVIEPQGPFDLRLAAGFGFGPDEGRRDADEAVMRLAFVTDDLDHHAGVVLTQDAEGRVHGTAETDGDLDAVRAQVARVLSLDHDGRPFLEAGERDPVLGAIQQRYPGLRPVLFHSPYEAAAWALISHRRPAAQAAATRAGLAQRLGATFDLAGQTLHAFPRPERLLEITAGPGLPDVKVERLHALARAALDGRLDVARLQAMDPDDAMTDLQQLAGIGPFWSALLVVRATGLADVLPTSEPRLLHAVQNAYNLPDAPDAPALTTLAEPWRPRRTWACVLLRYAAGRDA